MKLSRPTVARLLVAVLLASCAAGAAHAADLRPIRGALAEIAPAAVSASVDADRARSLAGLRPGANAHWPAKANASAAASVQIALAPGRPGERWLVIVDLAAPVPAAGRIELWARGRSGFGKRPVASVALRSLHGATARLELPGRSGALQLRLLPDGAPLRLERLRVLRLDPKGRNDY
ncbi:MAG: hypothetical protein D6776_08185, partial [Planctomycetota bacterium]